MTASAFLFAVLDSFIKLLGPSFRIWDIAFYRFGFGLIVLVSLFGWKNNPFRSNNVKLLIIRGIIGSLAFLSLVATIQLIPISTAMVLFYSFPAFAALFSTLFLREKVTRFELLCIILTFCGVAIIFDLTTGGNLVGQLIGLLAACFAGLAIITIKQLRGTNGPVVIYLYFCLLGAATALPPFVANPQLPRTHVQWLLVIGIMASSLAAQLLMNQGFHYCKSWEGGLFLTSEVIFTSLFGILFLNEIVTWRFWLGGCLIVSSIIALNWGNARRVSYRAVPPPALETHSQSQP